MMTRPTSRTRPSKSSYRPVQIALVVASFAASFAGAIWLQGQDANVASGTTRTPTIVAEAQVRDAPPVDALALKATGLELAPIPTVVPAVPVVRQPRAVARSRSSR
jgi:hypothetical protein